MLPPSIFYVYTLHSLLYMYDFRTLSIFYVKIMMVFPIFIENNNFSSKTRIIVQWYETVCVYLKMKKYKNGGGVLYICI